MGTEGGAAVKKERTFDFSKFPTAHVALRLAYHGQTHDGLARQENSKNTIEFYLIEALKKVRLVDPAVAEPPQYSRCGRTDKGVSALGNVISLTLRANKEGEKPLDYPGMLNRALPNTIRIVGYALVKPDFDARFSCVERVYKYFFNSKHCGVGESDVMPLDVERMRDAARRLVGTYDFRNFCKMDIVHVSNFVREVRGICIDASPVGDVYMCTVVGNAFLYHQIRCIMAVLFAVGKGREEPSVVDELLDVTKNPQKPCYALASDLPLVLWDCRFDGVEWVGEGATTERALRELDAMAREFAMRSAVASMMATEVRRLVQVTPTDAKKLGIAGLSSGGSYVPLMRREKEKSYEDKVQSLSANKAARREANTKKRGRELSEKDEVSDART